MKRPFDGLLDHFRRGLRVSEAIAKIEGLLEIAAVRGGSIELFFQKTVAKEQQSVLQPVHVERAGDGKLAMLKSDFLFGEDGSLMWSPCFDPQKIIGDRVDVQLESAEPR